jgi:hypothetical protein
LLEIILSSNGVNISESSSTSSGDGTNTIASSKSLRLI